MCCLLAVVAGVAQDGQVDETDPWAPLNLIDVQTEQGRVRLDPALEANVDEVRQIVTGQFATLRSDMKEFETLAEREGQIVDRINDLIGFDPDAEQRELQRRVFLTFLRMSRRAIAPPEKLEIIVIRRETLVGFLRSGGELPNVTYDAETDTGSLRFWFSAGGADLQGVADDGKEWDGITTLPLIVKNVEDLSLTIEELKNFNVASLPVHELAEVSIVTMLEYSDFGPRWFNDGFANVLAEIVLAEVGADSAREALLASLDVDQFDDIAKEETMLRYWPNGALEFGSLRKATEYEERLRLARYAWAHHEAKRIVDDHGIGVIRRIMERAAAANTPKADYMIGYIRQVTGEDMLGRLRQYQQFHTWQNGIDLYAERAAEAHQAGDLEAEFSASSRMSELVLKQGYEPRMFLGGAITMALLGEFDLGLEVLRRQPKVAPAARSHIHRYICSYSVDFRHYAEAYESAAYLIDRHIATWPARIVRAHELLHEKEDRAASRELLLPAIEEMRKIRDVNEEVRAKALRQIEEDSVEVLRLENAAAGDDG